jgi:DNA repair protein RecN (Recombination protein N)
MLTHLSIRGLAIIDQASIEFGKGFNVITGETGAGKSIIVKALNLLTGIKSTPDQIRQGYDEAVITAQFSVRKTLGIVSITKQYALPILEADDDSEVQFILRRHLSIKGKSSGYVNDVPVTLATLKEIATGLIDIFGQHDNNRLLNPAHHLNFIDLFIKNTDNKTRYSAELDALDTCIHELQEAIQKYSETLKTQDYIRFRSQELEDFNPSKEDFESAQHICKSFESSVATRDSLSAIKNLIDLSVDEQILSKPLWEAHRLLERLVDRLSYNKDTFAPLVTESQQIASRIDDLSYEINRHLDALDIDESALEKAQSRLAGYQSLFRKFAVNTIEGLIEERSTLQQNLQLLDDATQFFSELLGRIESHVESCKKYGATLSNVRKKSADFISDHVSKQMQSMAMPSAIIETIFEPAHKKLPEINLAAFSTKLQTRWEQAAQKAQTLGANGLETAMFLGRTNKGETLLPLHKMASGGELSRIMLAIKTVSAMESEPTVLVFDEIDAGISGKVADTVGKKIKFLAQSFQVICISHLPQVAVYADTHVFVQKREDKTRTFTAVQQLPESERAKEIARLLSGTEVTSPSISNAKELLRKARQTSAETNI